VQRKVFDAQTARNAYLMITASGRRVELRQVSSSNIYLAGDSSYLQLTDNGATLLVHSTDGTQLSFTEINNEWRCVEVKDRNGNHITVNHNALGRISTITDTLGRVITFNYDVNANLISITQAWSGQPSHQWVGFNWGTRNMQSSFSGAAVIGPKNGTSLPVITQVTLNDTSHFTFDYNNSLQVYLVRKYFGALQRSEITFTYETPGSDVPRLTDSRISAHNWTGINGVPSQVITQYSIAGDGACVMTAPDGTIYKEYYGTGWQRGLTTLSEIWSGGVKQKWTTTAWTQDTTSVGYEVNPRVTETNVYDAGGNRRRIVIDYGPYAHYGLPYGVREFAADGVTEIRQTYTDYNLSQAYLDKRIIGLVAYVHISNVAQWQTKISFDYDDPARLHGVPAAATQHDVNYNLAFTARGNVTAVSRWDVTDSNNAAKKLTTYTNYYNTGTPISTTDPSGHQSNITYGDAFSDSVNRNTFAYPTTITDADGFSSLIQYNFDFGATTRTQSPAPAGQAQGAIQTIGYNSLGQLERVTTTNNGAYKRFWYGPDYTASYATVNNVADEAYSIEVMDGVGQVIGAAANHPGSSGLYRLVNTVYDQMGRAWQISNPGEVNNSWVPSGDDSAGLYYTLQTYDWQGRPLRTTHPNTTYREASYSGCGCAGGAVVTMTDEGSFDTVTNSFKRRQQKIYSDVLGRTVKTEILNWQGGSVYSATVNTYNVRDQVTQVREYAGPEGSGTYQDTTMTYDGHGRLKTKRVPEQSAGTATVWSYNADDTINSIADARSASETFTYNNRHLVTSITYAAPGGSGIAVPAAVSFTYDAAGNRTKMTDGFGDHTYHYNQLSRLTQESRQFPVGTFSISYSYNLAGQLSGLTDPFAAGFTYTRDPQGRLKSLTGTPYAGTTNYISDVQYRAWGAAKSITYSGSNSTIAYNARMQPYQFRYTGGNPIREDYGYFADGTLSTLTDLDDTAGTNPPVTLRFLSRAYRYDHAKRVISGTGAIGGALPYRQNYSYDQFGNMTSRSGNYYNYNSSAPNTDTATYTNNRRSNWSYNAEGKPISTPATSTDLPRTMTYDAAGRMVSSVETGPFNTVTYSPAYDGDGKLVRESSSVSPGVSQLSYVVRSTVLGGEVLTRLDASGNKLTTHVPAEGLLFATQRSSGAPGPFVMMTHRNPLGITEGNKAVYDPLGNYIPFTASGDPRPPAGSYNSASMGGLSSAQSNPDSYAVGCVMDGLPTNCTRVMKSINRDEAESVTIHGLALTPAILRLMASFQTVKYAKIGSDGEPMPAEGGFFVPGRQTGFEQDPTNPQDTPIEIARKKNCATPNSLVETFKGNFESLWDRTVNSGIRGEREGEENGTAIFYESSNNTYLEVQFSQGYHFESKSGYYKSGPQMPNARSELRKAITGFETARRKMALLAVFHTHPNFLGGDSRNATPTSDDKDFLRDFGNPLGIIRSGKGYGFFIKGKEFGPDDPKANECIWDLIHAK
jgi:YD repeat-containing protein